MYLLIHALNLSFWHQSPHRPQIYTLAHISSNDSWNFVQGGWLTMASLEAAVHGRPLVLWIFMRTLVLTKIHLKNIKVRQGRTGIVSHFPGNTQRNNYAKAVSQHRFDSIVLLIVRYIGVWFRRKLSCNDWQNYLICFLKHALYQILNAIMNLLRFVLACWVIWGNLVSHISMASCKTVETPLLTPWSYRSLAPNHRYLLAVNKIICIVSAINKPLRQSIDNKEIIFKILKNCWFTWKL